MDENNKTKAQSRSRRAAAPADPSIADVAVPPIFNQPIVAQSDHATPPIEEVERVEDPAFDGSTLRPHDVVQVIDQSSRLYGIFFAVGGVKHQKVHGYYLTEGRQKQYVTVPLNMVHPVGGLAKIRSGNPCSPKWLSDNR